MTNHVDRFQAAVTALAVHGHIKQRLIRSYEDNLAEIHDDELPLVLQQRLADLRLQMHNVSPLNGEGPICASVRKMSLDEASERAMSIVTLFRDVVRLTDKKQSGLPLADSEDDRVPPFLVKSN